MQWICINPNCDKYYEPQGASGEDPLCECGFTLEQAKKEPRRNPINKILVFILGPVILVSVVVFAIKFINGGPSSGDNSKKYETLKSEFKQAIKAENVSKAEKNLAEMEQLDRLKNCSGCKQKLEALKAKKIEGDSKKLVTVIETVEKEPNPENYYKAEEILEQLRLINGKLDENFEKYDQKLVKLKDQITTDLNATFEEALRDGKFEDAGEVLEKIKEWESRVIQQDDYTKLKNQYKTAVTSRNVSEAKKLLSELRKDDENLEKCPECEKMLDDLYNNIKSRLKDEVAAGNISEARKLLSDLKELDENLENCPECKNIIPSGGDTYPENFAKVETGEYLVPAYFKRYIRYVEEDAVVIEKPFSIQTREVTVGEFWKFVESVDNPEQYGTRWEMDKDEKSYSPDRPVENVSRQEASDYAEWLSKQTNSDYRLPTHDQWVAASIEYGEDRPVLNRQDNQPLSELRHKVDHLIGNLREWSSDSCENGMYRLLGENYMTDNMDPNVVGKGNCAPDEKWSGVGFRLVKITD